MSGTYTKGPWAIIQDSVLKTAIDAGPKHIAMVNYYASHHKELNVTGEEHEANARLIAAAPELLEALKDMLDLYHSAVSRLDGHDVGMVHDQDTIDSARAAIAKATGEQP